MSRIASQALGVGLFLFIPAVLYLFVRHPEPVGASLLAGVVLMIGHRFLARPYAQRVRGAKCVWCNRWLGEADAVERLSVREGGAERIFAVCAGHVEPARRLFVWLDRFRLPLRAGIGLPLVALLAALAAAAFGRPAPLATATELFRFVIGITVNVAAWGPLAPAAPGLVPRAPFPLHNFSLLGARAILWILRLVGIWWVVASARELLAIRVG